MKKVPALFMVIVICLGLCVSASAAGATVTVPSPSDMSTVTVTLSNIVATTVISVPYASWDEEGNMVTVEKDITVYTMGKEGSEMTVTVNSDFDGDMYFPGGWGGYGLYEGKYGYEGYHGGFEGQLFTATPREPATYFFELNEYLDPTDIWEIYIGGSLSVFITFADLSAYAKVAADAPAEPAAPSFNDVAETDYFFESVKWAVEKGITDGTTDTTFSPAQTCSTAHILTFLWRAVGSPEVSIDNPFGDISGSEYYYKPALWAYENGLVSGNAFNGSSDCTRSMTVTYLWKLAGKPEAAPASFSDVAANDEYAEAVAWAVAEGITDGTSDTTFSPAQTCTRGQIVTFLWRNLA